MNFEKLTTKFQQAFAQAQSLAAGHDHRFIEPAHVLLAMLDQNDSSIVQLLSLAGANVNQIRSNLTQLLENLPKIHS